MLPGPTIEDLAKRLVFYDFDKSEICVTHGGHTATFDARDRAAALIAKLIHQEIDRTIKECAGIAGRRAAIAWRESHNSHATQEHRRLAQCEARACTWVADAIRARSAMVKAQEAEKADD